MDMHKNLPKRWLIAPVVPASMREELKDYPPIFQQVLYNRGIQSAEAAAKFLSADIPINEPHLLKDMQKGAERVQRAIDNQEKILVFGDYDVDGVTATVLLFECLTMLGGRVIKYIPNRFEEGYGFSADALEAVLRLAPDVVVTVDCGVRSIDEIAQANKAGIDVIITDHHQPYELLPNAYAIICPWQPGDEYPFKSLSGVGLAYKLADALSKKSRADLTQDDRWLDLVALGTIADLAPLTDENRVLVRRGLKMIHKGNRRGLVALANVSGISIEKTTAEDVGYALAPRLNAAGRLSSAESAFHLLISTDSDECGRLALLLEQENARRQDLTKKIQEEVESQVVNIEGQSVLFYYSDSFNEGVVGLVASKLSESFYRPAMIGSLNEGVIRASCRSIPEVNITQMLDQVSDLLAQHGGHAMAAGFKLEEKYRDIFIERISSLIAQETAGKTLISTIEADAEVELPDLHIELLDLFQLLEPIGEDNPPPLLVARSVEILRSKTVGHDGSHLKLAVRNPKKGGRPSVVFDAIAFNFGHLGEAIQRGEKADILFSYEWNEYNGSKQPQLKIHDMRLLET